ncbi:60S ribosomal protein L13a, putative [Cryptosporidium muris RN66]|uniref:60S ribosomal protein L13a, putative n=1 Tax=Cryptosporidium muris (strain RN66) TaxID=441375 RepID=B6A9Y0_CRYMR|nr:60S ribosomal protein L13a, putative [Cryptosporidium muris RN66]EEA05021.1 60S ribosomal protein L13a, putative [Cryptosporidium muris RN66]|eukprot:XP_002139370.1 60S ribosomal protein L13a [Cryptosporidium muris RN66]
MFKEQIVIDCRGALLGRLASIIAKELLNGQKIIAVRCEDINVSGSLYRNRMKYQDFLRKRMNTNPRRGPFHHRSPSRILFRTVRGMIPHKTARGAAALARLTTTDGCPAPFDKMKRMVVPTALRVLRLKPGRQYTVLGELSALVGFNRVSMIKSLEEKRKARSHTFFVKKVAHEKNMKKIQGQVFSKLTEVEQQILRAAGQC